MLIYLSLYCCKLRIITFFFFISISNKAYTFCILIFRIFLKVFWNSESYLLTWYHQIPILHVIGIFSISQLGLLILNEWFILYSLCKFLLFKLIYLIELRTDIFIYNRVMKSFAMLIYRIKQLILFVFAAINDLVIKIYYLLSLKIINIINCAFHKLGTRCLNFAKLLSEWIWCFINFVILNFTFILLVV